MSDQEKTTLFNPKDKLNEREKPKIYIDYIPQKLKAVAKKINVSMILYVINGIQMIQKYDYSRFWEKKY